MSSSVRSRLLLAASVLVFLGFAVRLDPGADKFRQLEEILPTANSYRTASGAPGHEYWQQRADYVIDVELDDDDQRILGSEQITYHNQSPDTLRYLWVQIDPNLYSPESHSVQTSLAPDLDGTSYRSLKSLLARRDFDGGAKITRLQDGDGRDVDHTIVDTMMRVDLATPLTPGSSTVLNIDWHYRINPSKLIRGRTGAEYFEDDGNYIYELAQWFPRMAAYTDATGWQHKQYLGRGEFTLEFGDYRVRITVPDDHVVASTGVLKNGDEVLTPAQRERLTRAATAERPTFIVTPDEARDNQGTPATGKKTWEFHADNVRDFAFASSRKFIWDAQGHPTDGRTVMAMSFYPNEGEPLWSKYSTHAIIHTLNVYGKFTFPYPYPVAISVNGPVGGMEYPMICFNGPRPEKDGTYSKRSKYGLISVVIHEVGHNWFPMIVNSDERQWTWMDEGLNTFLQYLAEQEWEEDYPSWRGRPDRITGYMTSDRQVPVMTNSESLLQFGNNAYAKPATALNILRETVMGRELFDFAFQEFSRRWRFRRPQPADFFRSMEDASAVDLDWFWRGWFYTTDHVDVAIENLHRYQIDTRDPEVEEVFAKAKRDAEPVTLSKLRNASLHKRTDDYPELLDFYNEFDELDITPADRKDFDKLLEDLKDDDRALLGTELNFYVVELRNVGGLVSPVILEVEFEDDSTEEIRIPAEIWRIDSETARKLIPTTKPVRRVSIDPHLEMADADVDNNHFPRKLQESRIQLKKSERERKSKNPMQKARGAEEGSGDKQDGDKADANAGGKTGGE